MTVSSAEAVERAFRSGAIRDFLRLFTKPEYLFLAFGGLASLILLILIPPLAGGNEPNNFQPVAAVAAGHVLIEPASVPGGIVKLLDASNRQFPENTPPPYHYSMAKLRALASIPLSRESPATLNPNAITVLNPISYIPQVVVYWTGLALDFSPLALFYLGRIAGALSGLLLTFLAIRRMPFHRYGMAALALLPTIVFSRTTLDADQITHGIAFYFVANAFAAMVEPRKLSCRALTTLVVSGLLIAQSKSAYFVLLQLVLAIPVARYGSRLRWLFASALIALPGTALNIAWMVALKHTYVAGLHYYTWAGHVYPDGQTAFILQHPLAYLGVLVRTIFTTNLIPLTLLGFIGIFGPPVAMPVVFYAVLVAALFCVLAGEGDAGSPSVPTAAKWLTASAFISGFVLLLTLIYIKWDSPGASVIQGFQGRYLFPLAAPALTCLPRSGSRAYLGLGVASWTAILAATSLFGTVFVTWTTYWG